MALECQDRAPGLTPRELFRAQGITKVTVKGRPTRPGQFTIAVTGKNGSYAVPPNGLPRLATIVLDPPVAATGQCVEVSFSELPGCTRSSNGSVICR